VLGGQLIPHILPYVGPCEMARLRIGVSTVLDTQGRWLGGSGHEPEGFPVHAHVCSTEASCFLTGPRWLIYPILSYPLITSPFYPFLIPIYSYSYVPTTLSRYHRNQLRVSSTYTLRLILYLLFITVDIYLQ
jgi:hypothetical protein